MPVIRKNMQQFRKVYPGIRKTPKYDTRVVLDQNLTMYGEEFTTAEIARSLKMPIYYEPNMEVTHVEHSSNKINWFNSFHLTKKAYYYFLKEYL